VRFAFGAAFFLHSVRTLFFLRMFQAALLVVGAVKVPNFMFSAGVSAHAFVKLAWVPSVLALAIVGSEQATWERHEEE
jgi:glycine/D-amino acid oxidase-like deaminating enzyme